MTLGKMETGLASLPAAASDGSAAMTVSRRILLSASAVLWGTTALAQSLPTGGTVAEGDVAISQPSGTQS